MNENKFEKGKWYRYTSKEGTRTWSPDMAIVLDGKPHLCTNAEKEEWQIPHDSNNAFAAFDGGDVKDWRSVQENFQEVNARGETIEEELARDL